MITKNYKNFLKGILLGGDNAYNLTALQIKDVTNATRYACARFDSNSYFPYGVTYTVKYNSNQQSTGIYVGTGTTPPTENDYQIENVITTGLSANTPTLNAALDADGNPYKRYIITFTNTTASDITITEVGYVQCLSAANTAGGFPSIFAYTLLDRTLLDTPLTVPANGNAVLVYELKSIIS